MRLCGAAFEVPSRFGCVTMLRFFARPTALKVAFVKKKRVKSSVYFPFAKKVCVVLVVKRVGETGHYVFTQSLLAPHTSGPRDVPRCGALSLLQKDAALQGGVQ
jgi:hypothetical protein